MTRVFETPGDASKGIEAGASVAATAGLHYDAFVSYSQKADKAIAQALRSVIQTIGKPWWKVRSLNVFLDATSLSAAPGLWQSIEEKLGRSRYLILLASPEAAQSKWVDKEVSHFIGQDSAGLGRVLIGLTDGNLAWDTAASDFAWDEATPLPPSLRGRFNEEPLWVDLRPFRADPSRATKSDQAFLHAALDLAATIKGVEKADLYSDEVKRQRRSRRIAWGIAAVFAVLSVGAGAAAWVAVEQARRAEAEAVRAIAAAEQATRSFDAAWSTVNRIVLGIAQVENMEVDDFRTIFKGVEMDMWSLANAALDDPEVQRKVILGLLNMGDVRLEAGDAAGALSTYRESLGIARRLTEIDSDNMEWRGYVSVSLALIGDAKLGKGNVAGALSSHEEGLIIARGIADSDPGNAKWQLDLWERLNGIGDVKIKAGDAAGALSAYEEGLAIARRLAEADVEDTEWLRNVSVSLNTIGDVKMGIGDTAGALSAYEEKLAHARRLTETDPEDPEWQRDLAASLRDIRRMVNDEERDRILLEEEVLLLERLGETGGLDVTDQKWLAESRRELAEVRTVAETSGP